MRFIETLGRGLRSIADLVVPPTCAACDGAVAHRRAVCASCADMLGDDAACLRCGMFLGPSAKASERCNGCAGDPPAFTRLVAAAPYGDAARVIVHRFKFNGRTRLAAWMADAMLARWREVAPGAPDAVVPVPSMRSRLRERGFNPAALLARRVAQHLGLPMIEPLVATDEVAAPQHGLSRAARLTAAVNRFATRSTSVAVPGSVLLVDDVSTTLATLHACATLLRERAASRVYALTFARVE
jgi:ComF family protein